MGVSIDSKALAQSTASIVREYVGARVDPLMAEIETLRARVADLEEQATRPVKREGKD